MELRADRELEAQVDWETASCVFRCLASGWVVEVGPRGTCDIIARDLVRELDALRRWQAGMYGEAYTPFAVL
eukprot:14318635-Heterocapsa_arctica.AAC.1